MKHLKVAIVLGTRPEIIKCSPVIRASIEAGHETLVIHSNQHYSEALDQVFFRELELPAPDYNLNIGSGTHGAQTAKILAGLEPILMQEQPDVVLVQGDTNTVLGGALTASKLNIPVGHIEAGLRSHFWWMPEEKNRVLTDHMSDQLYAPSSHSVELLKKEGLADEKIFMVGNTIVDAVYQNSEIAKARSKALKTYDLNPKSFILVTAHRAENIDDWSRFRSILEGVESVAHDTRLPVLFPIHPRAKKILEQNPFSLSEHIRLIDPVGYFDFLQLQENAKLILTDSGGVQEESCILGTPCVTLRDNTERPETLNVGSNMLTGANKERIISASQQMLSVDINWKNPFGDGRSGKKIIDCLHHLKKE